MPSAFQFNRTEMARACGCSQRLIDQVWNGKQMPKLGMFKKMSQFLVVSMDDLWDHMERNVWNPASDWLW